MGSESLLTTRMRYLTLAITGLMFALTGYLIARGNLTLGMLAFCLSIGALMILDWIYRYTLKSVTYFFRSLKNDDPTLHFPVAMNNAALVGLFETMNSLNRHFQEIRMKNEYHEKYLRMLIQHTAAGLLVVNGNEQIELINDQACRYAGIPPESTNLNLLKVRNPEFYAAVCETKPGSGHTYRQTMAGQVQVLSFKATLFKRNLETLHLISIQDIQRELDLKEGESYRKLISVLTHEIMNLMSPITSVAGVLEKIYLGAEMPAISKFDDELIRTTRNSVAVIRDQSLGISNFLGNYRKISRLPEPELVLFDAAEWIDQLRIAFSGKMLENNIQFDLIHDKSLLRIKADKKLINQLMINILNNAIDAVRENQEGRLIRIRLDHCRKNGVKVTVSNNGPVIPPERKDKIFVPFYTTKKEGSGIGLSICQEIVRAHRGTLTLVSGPEHMTSFILEL